MGCGRQAMGNGAKQHWSDLGIYSSHEDDITF